MCVCCAKVVPQYFFSVGNAGRRERMMDLCIKASIEKEYLVKAKLKDSCCRGSGLYENK